MYSPFHIWSAAGFGSCCKKRSCRLRGSCAAVAGEPEKSQEISLVFGQSYFRFFKV
jgi:hypothetical protein